MQQSAAARREGSAATAATTGSTAAASAGGTGPAASRASTAGSTVRQRTTRTPARSAASAGGGLQPLQQKLQQHIDREDRRIKELTEGILYDFFPAALRAVLPPGADPATGLSPAAARSVASAALTVATLMNAPPGFLEFLLCVPWADLGALYLRPEREGGGGELAVPQLLTSQTERAALVNVRLDPALMDCVLDFLYREQHQESLPPMIRLSPPGGAGGDLKGVADPGGVTREMAAALLDGATPLHCAAIRGNPAQVDHLLLCGADPLLANAAGELPLEVVPVCGDRCLGNGKLSCRCMGARDQEAWECRSRLARTLILRRCVMQFRNGLSAWVRMAMLCLMCLLGFWGNHTTLHRPAIEQHASRRAEARRRKALQQTQATLLKMRTNAASGRQALDAGGGGGGLGGGAPGAAASNPPDPHEHGGGGGSSSYTCSAGLGVPGEQRPEDYAYACFSQAVQLLKELDLRPSGVPAGFIQAAAPGEEPAGGPAARVLPDEQAAIYCGWAEAALRKSRACGCAGCAALAMHAVAAGQRHVALLLASPDLMSGHAEERVTRVGAAMARLVHCKAVLLLQTDVRHSATRAAIWRAQQCLQEWERLRQLGMAAALAEDDFLDLACLDSWCRAASADMLLLEALRGSPLAPLQPLGEALPLAVGLDPSTGVPTLLRPVGRDVVRQLMGALAAARPHASDHIVRVAEAVASHLQAEIQAGDRLRELLQPRSGGMNVDDLAEAVRAAERYPSLQAEVEQARALKDRWLKRAEAQAQFDAAVDSMSGPASRALLLSKPGAPPVLDADAFWSELNSRVQQLEAATEEARHANIGVAKAKRVLKELQAQGAAVEAAARLDEALAQPRCTSASLKAALSKAEAAAAAAATAACQFAVGAELLHPRISAAKQKLGVEKAAEGLARAAATCRAVADLPRLEAAILAARKVGAQELDPEAYKTASEMRLRLDGASKARGALDAALRNLQKMGRQDDADAVERCVEEADQLGGLLAPDVARAREAVQRWRAAAAAEARLTRALRDGVGTAPLSRAIKEAAAAGVKVGEARRLLKLMQGLEAALQAATEGPLQYQALKSRIEQAEAGGCPEPLVAEAKRTLHRLLLGEVRAELDAALKTSRAAEKAVAYRLSSLKAVLDKADVVLAMDEELQAQQAQQAAAASERAASEGGASECTATSAPGPASQQGQEQAQKGQSGSQARRLHRSDTGLSASSSTSGAPAAGALGRAEPGSSSSLPPGLAATRQESFASDTGSPLAAAVDSSAGALPPSSVYVSAAPSVSREQSGGSDADVAVLLEASDDGTVQLSILLPAAAEGEEAEGQEEEDEEDGELPPELAGDELAVVKHMVRQARRLLAREEAEQARIERERQEEARARREQQLREKAERERADRERAERARAERAERKAALEQQKAERRERERQQRLEKERQRQEREKLAKEHFALLQKQRRLLAQPPPAAALPDVPALPLDTAVPGLLVSGGPAQQAQQLGAPGVAAAGLFASLPGAPAGSASSALGTGLSAAAGALELWAGAGSAAPGGFANLPGLLQHAQHDRSDSLELLSEQQGLLDLLNDQTPDAAAAAAASEAAPFGRNLLDASPAAGEAAGAGAAAATLRSPAGTPASEGWEGASGAAGAPASSALPPPALGSGPWSSVEGSVEGLPGPDPVLSAEPSPIKQQLASTASAETGPSGGGFLGFDSGLWLSGMQGSSQPLAPGSGGGLLWGSSGNLAAAAAPSPSRHSVQDDLALTGLASRLWQSGATGSASASGDGWAEVLSSVSQQQGSAGSLLPSPQRMHPAASASGGTSLAGFGGGSAGPAGLSSGASLALLQQQRQQKQQLAAALDAHAQLLLQQQQGAGSHQPQRQLCKYFLHGFCREGDNCRFSHTLSGAAADAQQAQRTLSLQRLSAGAPQPPPVQQQPGAAGVLSFGAPGAAAFAGSGAPGSGGPSRSGTPDIRLGVGAATSAPATSAPATSAPLPASSSGFSVNAPAFSPREPLSKAGSNTAAAAVAAAAAAGAFPPGTASLPAFAGLGAALSLEAFAGGVQYGASRPGSAAASAFATPRDNPRHSSEAEAFEDALDAQQPLAAGARFDAFDMRRRRGYGAGEGAGDAFHDAYGEGQQVESAGQGGYGAEPSNTSDAYASAARHYSQYGLGGFQTAYRGAGFGAGRDLKAAYGPGDGGDGGDGRNAGEEYCDASAGGPQDSLGLPSEASLFQDLPGFFKDATDE